MIQDALVMEVKWKTRGLGRLEHRECVCPATTTEFSYGVQLHFLKLCLTWSASTPPAVVTPPDEDCPRLKKGEQKGEIKGDDPMSN